MNQYVETLKRNEVLDSLRLMKAFNLNPETLELKDSLGIIGDVIGNEGQLIFGKFRLVLVWDSKYGGLQDSNKYCSSEKTSDDMIRDDILHNTEECFYKAVKKFADYVYVLNISSASDIIVFNLNSKHSKELINQQITTFLPIIQKFIVDALTDDLYILEEGKLVKQ